MELENKVVVITGGSEGMGLALARLFRDQGARVVVCAKSFEQNEEGITQKNCDVTD